MAATAEQVKEWQNRSSSMTTLNLKAIEGSLAELDAHLTLRSFLVGYEMTDADTTVWKVLRENRVAHSYIKQGLMVNLARWFKFIEETNPSISLAERPLKGGKGADGEKTVEKDEGGSYEIGLQDTEHGVVTRFPPEPR